jgi:hypothetical protein
MTHAGAVHPAVYLDQKISEVIESSVLNLVPGLGCVYIFSTATPVVCVHIYTHQYLGTIVPSTNSTELRAECVYIFSTGTPVCVHIYTHQYLGT